MNSLCHDFRSQASMHEPLLKPHRFQCSRRHFTQERRDVWSTESAESRLAWIAIVWIARVERRTGTRENQKCLKVSLEQHVNMHPLSDVSAVAHVTRHRIECVRWLSNSSLYCEPGVEVGHVIQAGCGSPDLLLQLVRAEVAVLVEELR